MKKEPDPLIHFHIASRGFANYVTPCNKDGGEYYLTQVPSQVTCKICKQYNEKE